MWAPGVLAVGPGSSHVQVPATGDTRTASEQTQHLSSAAGRLLQHVYTHTPTLRAPSRSNRTVSVLSALPYPWHTHRVHIHACWGSISASTLVSPEAWGSSCLASLGLSNPAQSIFLQDKIDAFRQPSAKCLAVTIKQQRLLKTMQRREQNRDKLNTAIKPIVGLHLECCIRFWSSPQTTNGWVANPSLPGKGTKEPGYNSD